jgi:hypothetical protein
MYYSGTLDWREKRVKLIQNSDIPNDNSVFFKIGTENETKFTLRLRIPPWCENTEIKVNGENIPLCVDNGYAIIQRVWKENDTVEVIFQIVPKLAALPDNSNAVAFTYGPVVLSAGLGTEKMEESTTGVIVQIPTKHVEIKDYLVIKGQKVDEWKKNIAQNLKKTEGKLEFRLKGTDEDDRLVFTPHYRQHTQRYGIYWILVEEGSKQLNEYIERKKRAEKDKEAEIDSIQIGNDQYESTHAIDGQYTESGNRDGFHYRYAQKNGWFSYDLRINKGENSLLQIKYMPGDCKSGFDILVNDTLLSHEVMGTAKWNEPFAKTYHVNKELAGEKDFITVKFAASANDETARIIDVIRTLKDTEK